MPFWKEDYLLQEVTLEFLKIISRTLANHLISNPEIFQNFSWLNGNSSHSLTLANNYCLAVFKDCKDTDTKCPSWALLKQCKSGDRIGWMNTNCRKSCGLCRGKSCYGSVQICIFCARPYLWLYQFLKIHPKPHSHEILLNLWHVHTVNTWMFFPSLLLWEFVHMPVKKFGLWTLVFGKHDLGV